MNALAQILLLALFIAAGAVLPRLQLAGRTLAPPARRVDSILKLVLRLLLVAMGFRIGNDRSLVSQLARIGILGAAAGALAIAGTLLAVFLALLPSRLRRGAPMGDGRAAADAPAPPAKTANLPKAAAAPRAAFAALWGRLREPLSLIAFIAAGLVLGIVLPRLDASFISSLSTWILYALLFLIGMQFSQSGVSLRGAFLDPRILVVPIATALGSLGAGLLLVPLFGLGPGKAMALVGGFGWYSLSGALIADLGDPALGSAAFLANMTREALALLSIPFLARSSMPQLAIAVGGATAMDVTLPLIEEGAGPGIVPASFASGALLSLLVPVLVPVLYRIAS